MRDFLSSLSRKFIVPVIILLLLPWDQSFGQCGLSSYPEGGTSTPTGTWQSVNVGSGTYADFNVTAGNIYSFRYSGSTVLGYDWDMTVSSSSAIIPYNNSLTPLNDSWTGGVVCPNTPRPTSAEWYSTFNGTFRVNTHLWNGTCHNFVGGIGSAVLQYKVCPTSPDPGPGTNQWVVDAFATADVAIPNLDARYGYYTDGNLNFVTTAAWGTTGRPSDASSWIGCEVPNDNFAIRARRVGFPCGYYKINVNNADDDIRIYVNGTQIFSAPCCITSTTLAASYVLGASDQVEIREVDKCGTGLANVSFVLQPVSAVTGGTIGGIANGTNVCAGPLTVPFTNVTSGSGGVSGLTNGSVISYDWEVSSDGGLTYNAIGVNSPNWTFNGVLPAGGVFVIRRKAMDKCGNSAYSNSITIIGQPQPNGSMAPATQTICPGTTAIITLNFNPGTSPFDISFSDGVSNYTRTGLYSGDTLHLNPVINTIYNFVTITDSFGCVRSSGFTGGAQVLVQPSINITSVNVADAGCFGGNNGSITINANGGVSPLHYSIDGGATTQLSNVFNNLSAGNYSAVVTDDFGCTQNYAGNPVVVGQPTDIVVDSTIIRDASCANVYDGSITIYASGGVPPYSYSINGGPSQPGNVFSGLASSTYHISIYDTHGCVDTSSVTIGDSYIISVNTISQTNLSCFGSADGDVTVQVNGGIPPYDYSINGITFQSSGTFSGLNAGTYIIVGRDSKGCTEFATVTITQPGLVTVTIDSITNVLCNGSATGGIYMTPSGGTPGYTFSWSNGANTEDNLNVTAGTYNVTVTDSHGCSAAGGATINQPLELFVNVALYSDLLCFNDSTGAIDVTANGGVPPYSYSWSNGSSSEDLDHLPAGTYTVTVTDANGCQKNLTQQIIAPTALTSSIVGTDVSCNGANDGAADLTVNGGTTPYFYQWSTFQATEDVTGLHGGLYYVIITDNNGCSQRDSVLIAEPLPLVLSTGVTHISCFNAGDGAIDLSVTGGTQPYSYAWSNGASSEDLTGLSGGTYVVTVTDAHNCTSTTSVILVNPTLISNNFIVTSPLCFGDNNGVIDLITSGGTPGYTYIWSNGATSEDLQNIPAGSYWVTVTDAKGCNKTDSTTVTEPAPIVTSGFIKNVTCNGYSDGMIDITAYGGTLPYSYQWSTGESTEDIIQLPGGNYYVTVTDAHGCIASTLYPVIEPPVLSVNVVGTPVSCFGGENGTVAAIPSGGVTPYEYLWNNFETDSSLQGISAGHYVVLLTDSNGCHTFDSMDIIQPTEITIAGVITDVACNGASTGAIDITVSGGTPGYTFSWSNTATTEDLTGLPAGVYTVSVTDANGCEKIASFTVNQAVSLFTNVSSSNPVCYGGSNGFISVDVTGGTIPYSYTWSTTPPQTGGTATNLEAGTYTLTTTDAGNCSATVTVVLTNPDSINITATGTDAKCYNTATGEVTATVTGGKPPYVYTLNGITQQNNTFANLASGTYVIAVRDANGCEGTKVFTIASPSQVSVDLTAPQSVILAGMTTQLVATANSSSPIVNYFWQPIDSVLFDFSNCTDPQNCYNPYVQPFYTTVFTVMVMNQDSCFASDTVSIIVENELSAFIPSAFTPNGDGLNDFFTFDILGATNIEIGIFSRWGERVFYNANQNNGIDAHNGWDGKKDGKALPDDTYVYQMKITYFDGVVRDKTGTVTIMK